jgi:hypothetical protein
VLFVLKQCVGPYSGWSAYQLSLLCQSAFLASVKSCILSLNTIRFHAFRATYLATSLLVSIDHDVTGQGEIKTHCALVFQSADFPADRAG